MLENNSTLQKSIIQYLLQFYNIEAHTLEYLPIGADLNASVYKAKARDIDFFVKIIKGPLSDLSISVMELLESEGLQHIVFPIKTVGGQPVQYVDGFTLLVYPFIPGEDGFSRPLTEEQWKVLGQALRKLHEIKIPTSLQKQIRQETYSSKFRDAVTLLYKNLHDSIATDATSSEFIEFLRQHSETVHKLITRAGELSQSAKNSSAQFVLCHADIHGGNVLIDENDAIYIVDWDSPIMAPKERDLMFIGGGVANVWNKPDEEILFYKGYGEAKIDMVMLAYYRHERIVEDIAEFADFILSTESGADSKLENYNHFKAMFTPNGVIDIAFRTDEISLRYHI